MFAVVVHDIYPTIWMYTLINNSLHMREKDLSGSVTDENGWRDRGLGACYLFWITLSNQPAYQVKCKLV